MELKMIGTCAASLLCGAIFAIYTHNNLADKCKVPSCNLKVSPIAEEMSILDSQKPFNEKKTASNKILQYLSKYGFKEEAKNKYVVELSEKMNEKDEYQKSKDDFDYLEEKYIDFINDAPSVDRVDLYVEPLLAGAFVAMLTWCAIFFVQLAFDKREFER